MKQPEPDYYGDNFPVPSSGSWDPAVPWRFPRHGIKLSDPPVSDRVLPWVMFGVGLGLGVLLMSWQVELPVVQAGVETSDQHQAIQTKSGGGSPAKVSPVGEETRRSRSRFQSSLG